MSKNKQGIIATIISGRSMMGQNLLQNKKKEQAGETNAPPKTLHQFGFHIVLPEYERSHAWFLMSIDYWMKK